MHSRRALLAGSGALLLAGCQTQQNAGLPPSVLAFNAGFEGMYGALPQEQFPVPAVDPRKFDARFTRREVDYNSSEPVGTIIVDTSGPFLYLVREQGRALRYGIGVGRQGFSWSGRATIQMKRAWPRWTPPSEMIDRQPELEVYREGMEPSLGNPLGARALYLFQDGRDTLYRIHGSNEPASIGKAVSSGCIRLINQDVIDLYERVPRGTQVVVVHGDSTITS